MASAVPLTMTKTFSTLKKKGIGSAVDNLVGLKDSQMNLKVLDRQYPPLDGSRHRPLQSRISVSVYREDNCCCRYDCELRLRTSQTSEVLASGMALRKMA